ncbi:response regulator transcription factor [Halorussus litoreus]|uniref:response regulator transcription factor n=1 Tax=Halorussus litoreus TaxID=1710536 RepID=UPI000E25112D|nr:response regulator [Halorussus litoreus]
MFAGILAADDDEDIREMIHVSLSEEFDVETVEDGEKAWRYLEGHSDSLPKVVVLDVMMPEMDGFSVLDRMKEQGNTQDIPVLMLTSRSREEDIVRALEAGADDFLAKPFNKSELYGRVQQILE